MRTIQDVCLQLFNKFIDVCEKYNLNWFVDSGTLLGAVRNGGMIPWDDDIDVIMPRDDYDKLHHLVEVEDIFDSPFFFQTAETDACFEIHAKLRLDGTACITNREKNGTHHKGMCLDIFVLDAVPDDEKELEAEIGFLRMLGRYSSLRNIYDEKNCFVCEGTAYHVMNNIIADSTIRNQRSEFVGNVMFYRYSDYIGVKFHREAYSNYELYPFAGLTRKVRVPIGYDEILRGWYGDDYMIEKHEQTFHSAKVDPNVDYKILEKI